MKKLILIIILLSIFTKNVKADFIAEEYHGAVVQGFGEPIHLNNGETLDFQLCYMNYCKYFFEKDYTFIIDFKLYGSEARIDFVRLEEDLLTYPRPLVTEFTANNIEMFRGEARQPFCYFINSDETNTAEGRMTFNVTKGDYFLIFRNDCYADDPSNHDDYITATINYYPLSKKASADTSSANVYSIIGVLFLSISYITFKTVHRYNK